MYNKILIGSDGSDLADKAIEAGLSLGKMANAKVVMLHVAMPQFQPAAFLGEAYVGPSEEDYAAELKEINAIADRKAAAAAARSGIDLDVVHVVAAEPWRAIIENASALSCDAIVMASHGRGPLTALLLGSDTSNVLSHCKLPVLVVR